MIRDSSACACFKSRIVLYSTLDAFRPVFGVFLKTRLKQSIKSTFKSCMCKDHLPIDLQWGRSLSNYCYRLFFLLYKVLYRGFSLCHNLKSMASRIHAFCPRKCQSNCLYCVGLTKKVIQNRTPKREPQEKATVGTLATSNCPTGHDKKFWSHYKSRGSRSRRESYNCPHKLKIGSLKNSASQRLVFGIIPTIQFGTIVCMKGLAAHWRDSTSRVEAR